MTFEEEFDTMSFAVFRTSTNHGWWDDKLNRNKGEMISLMHAELSEAIEALRIGNPQSEKIPEHSQVEEELADVIIRVMDMGAGFGYNISGAIIAKNEYNGGRPYKHGGRRF